MNHFDDSDWQDLLVACGGAIPGAWVAVRAFGEEASRVQWRAPAPPDDRPFASKSLYESPDGEVAILNWAEGQPTEVHADAGVRVFHCILVGCLNLTMLDPWNGRPTLVGERRGRAPDAHLIAPGQLHSLDAPEGAVTITIRAPVRASALFGDTDPALPVISPG